MTIVYWQPIHDAIQRTKGMLFRPFDLGRWFTLGFVAWLVYLGQSAGSAAGTDHDVFTSLKTGDWQEAFTHIGDSAENLIPVGLALAVILTLVIVGLVITVALLWVSCRARFVWLENLTAGDHLVGRHWNHHAHLADSFFLWRLGYYLLAILLVMPLVFFGGVFGALGIAGFDGPGSVMGWALLGVAAFVVGAILIYVDFFAESFVTVIMHRRGLGVLAAWREFRTLFDDQPGHFVLVGLMKMVLHMASGVVLTALGLVTCCIGFGIMAIPYLGTVFTLPVVMALRYYDLCWLGQLAPDLRLPALVSPAAPKPDSDPTP